MAITACIPDGYREEIMKGTHLSTHNYYIALYTSSATLNKSTTAYTATNEVTAGSGYTAGGKVLSGYATSIASNVAILDFADPSWTTATITNARGAMIYNSDNSNKVVAILDFGSDVSSTGGTFTVQFPAVGAATGLIRLA